MSRTSCRPFGTAFATWVVPNFWLLPLDSALSPSSVHSLQYFRRYGLFCSSRICSPIEEAGINPWWTLRPRFASSKKEAAKRIKNDQLDSLLTREKKYKTVLKLKEVLAKEKAHVMSLNDLGKLRKKMGVSRTKRFASFAASYPRIFNIIKDKDSMLWMEFTDEVEDLLEEEEQFRKNVHEPWVVGTLRKLLMLSADRRLAIDKVGHLKHELGLPDDFRTNLVHNYPQIFRVLDNGGSNGPLLELTDWDPSLAITARERNIKEESCEFDDLIGENTGYGFRIDNPKGYTLRKKQREVMARFQSLPFPSPYEDASGLEQNSLELEKRTVALVHEFLSLTLWKRAVVNHILHFRKEFRLPQRMLALLLRHQGIFYVSLKGDIHTVFLKEAFEGSTLKERNPFLDFNSSLFELCMIRKVYTVGSDDAQIPHGQKDKESQYDMLANIEKVDDNECDDKEESNKDEFAEEEESGEDEEDHNEEYADINDGADDTYTESSTDVDDIRPSNQKKPYNNMTAVCAK